MFLLQAAAQTLHICGEETPSNANTGVAREMRSTRARRDIPTADGHTHCLSPPTPTAGPRIAFNLERNPHDVPGGAKRIQRNEVAYAPYGAWGVFPAS
ncbi:hypothetical protein B0H11DRAFT_2257888 [Mycena galericulata]|nr:hypothetical protein B0H11DRAFT_2257888 [Mycena galericulata]